jgi:SAM-dependent methyltransferase
MDRRDRLLAFVDCENECGLEIGPLDKPLVERIPGRRIFYCDYAKRKELCRRSSSDPAVNTDLIPHIDFVASRITAKTFGKLKFDYIIASHVVEHVPDPINWLNSLLSAVLPVGRLILAVPDRRYTFDYTRPLSTAGQLIEAYLEKRTRPTPAQIYDAFSQALSVDTDQLWNRHEPPHVHRFSKTCALNLATGGEYRDCHCWVFTHDSFLSLIYELKSLNILKARVLFHSEPVYGSNEFHIVLGFDPSVPPLIRYEGKIIRQRPANRGKDDGWYVVRNGWRHWITNAEWLPRNGFTASSIIEIPSEEFYAIDEGAPLV